MAGSPRVPSPALIVAALALALALGGSAVAAQGITKSQVKKIAAKQIKKKAPALNVAKAQTAENAANAQNAVNAQNVNTLNKSGALKLALGQTRTVLTKGSLSFVAECVQDGANKRTQVNMKSTEPGSVFDGGAGAGDPAFGPGDDVLVVDVTNNVPSWAGFELQAATPSGTTLLAHVSGGVDVLGSDCGVVVTAVG